jgi:hypothetical protein
LSACACSREAVDLTADGGLAQLAQALPGGTFFEGYGHGQLVLAGCRVVGLLQDKQPVQQVEGQGEHRPAAAELVARAADCSVQP